MPNFANAVTRTLTDKLGEVPSLFDYGALGDGSHDDTGNIQTALDSVASSGGGALYAPSPTAFYKMTDQVVIPSNILLYGDRGASIFKRAATLAAGKALFSVPSTASNVMVRNITIDGLVTTSAQIDLTTLFSTYGAEPMNDALTGDSSFWVRAGASNVTFEGVTVTHTGGYAIIFDARSGNISAVQVFDCDFINNRPHLFGPVGDVNYGSWTGGILLKCDGTSYGVRGAQISRNRWNRVTGNCVWGHSNGFGSQHEGINITDNRFRDFGLDGIELGDFLGGIVSHNKTYRGGYIHATDSDVPAPAQDPTGRYSVAIDCTGYVQGCTIADNTITQQNGGGIDLDGFFDGSVTGNVIGNAVSTDPYYSIDQVALYGATKGIQTGNTYYGPAGRNINIQGNTILNQNTWAIVLSNAKNCHITDNKIYHPASAIGNPVLIINKPGSGMSLGAWTADTSGDYRSAGNVIENNPIDYSGANMAIAEAENYSGTPYPWSGTHVNRVQNNAIIGAGNYGEFLKAPSSGSIAGTRLPTNDATATSLSENQVQREGFGVTAAYKVYRNTTALGRAQLHQLSDHAVANYSENGVAGTGAVALGNRTSLAFQDVFSGGKMTLDGFMALAQGSLRTGVVNTSGTAVTRTSGDPFIVDMAGNPVVINAVTYTVAAFVDGSHITLSATAGTQTGVAYSASPFPTADADLLDDNWGLIRWNNSSKIFEQSITTSMGQRIWSAFAGGGGFTNPISGNLGINTVYFTQVEGQAGSKGIAVKGTTGRGNIDFQTGAGDGDGVRIGSFSFTDLSCSIPENRIALIRCSLSGPTANNRGGEMSLFVKQDNLPTGLALNERWRLDRTGLTTFFGPGPGVAAIATQAGSGFIQGNDGFFTPSSASTAVNVPSGGVTALSLIAIRNDGSDGITIARTSATAAQYGLAIASNGSLLLNDNTHSAIRMSLSPAGLFSFGGSNLAIDQAGNLSMVGVLNPDGATSGVNVTNSSATNSIQTSGGFTGNSLSLIRTAAVAAAYSLTIASNGALVVTDATHSAIRLTMDVAGLFSLGGSNTSLDQSGNISMIGVLNPHGAGAGVNVTSSAAFNSIQTSGGILASGLYGYYLHDPGGTPTDFQISAVYNSGLANRNWYSFPLWIKSSSSNALQIFDCDNSVPAGSIAWGQALLGQVVFSGIGGLRYSAGSMQLCQDVTAVPQVWQTIGTTTGGGGTFPIVRSTGTYPLGIMTEVTDSLINIGVNDSRFGTQVTASPGVFSRYDGRGVGNPVYALFTRASAVGSPSIAFQVAESGDAGFLHALSVADAVSSTGVSGGFNCTTNTAANSIQTVGGVVAGINGMYLHDPGGSPLDFRLNGIYNSGLSNRNAFYTATWIKASNFDALKVFNCDNNNPATSVVWGGAHLGQLTIEPLLSSAGQLPVSPTGTQAAIWNEAGTLYAWDVSTGARVALLGGLAGVTDPTFNSVVINKSTLAEQLYIGRFASQIAMGNASSYAGANLRTRWTMATSAGHFFGGSQPGDTWIFTEQNGGVTPAGSLYLGANSLLTLKLDGAGAATFASNVIVSGALSTVGVITSTSGGVNVTGNTAFNSIQSTGGFSGTSLSTIIYSNAAGTSGVANFKRARGTSGSPLGVQNGDTLGVIGAYGADSTNALVGSPSAQVLFQAVMPGPGGTTWNPGSQAARILFQTAPTTTSAAAGLATRMTIQEDGNVVINGTAAATSLVIQAGYLSSSEGGVSTTGKWRAGQLTLTDGSTPTERGGFRFSGGAVQFSNDMTTWANVAGSGAGGSFSTLLVDNAAADSQVNIAHTSPRFGMSDNANWFSRDRALRIVLSTNTGDYGLFAGEAWIFTEAIISGTGGPLYLGGNSRKTLKLDNNGLASLTNQLVVGGAAGGAGLTVSAGYVSSSEGFHSSSSQFNAIDLTASDAGIQCYRYTFQTIGGTPSGAAGKAIIYFDGTNLKAIQGTNAPVNLLGGGGGTITSIVNGTGVSVANPTGPAVTISIGQAVGTSSNVSFASVTTTGVMQSQVTGGSIAFQTTNFNFQVDGNGNISGSGQINMGNSYKLGGVTVINSSGAFIGNGVDVGSTHGVGARAFNPYDSGGTGHTGRDQAAITFNDTLGNPHTIQFVGGVLI